MVTGIHQLVVAVLLAKVASSIGNLLACNAYAETVRRLRTNTAVAAAPIRGCDTWLSLP